MECNVHAPLMKPLTTSFDCCSGADVVSCASVLLYN